MNVATHLAAQAGVGEILVSEEAAAAAKLTLNGLEQRPLSSTAVRSGENGLDKPNPLPSATISCAHNEMERKTTEATNPGRLDRRASERFDDPVCEGALDHHRFGADGPRGLRTLHQVLIHDPPSARPARGPG